MPFEYVSSFRTHPLWIRAKLGMDRYYIGFYMPTGEIRDYDPIRVCFEFQDSSSIDSRQIMYGSQMPFEYVSSFRLHTSWIRAKLGM